MDCLHLPETQENAMNYLRAVSLYIFNIEVRRVVPKEFSSRRLPGPLFSCLLDAFAYGFASEDPATPEQHKTSELVEGLLKDLISMPESSEVGVMDVRPTLWHLAHLFTSLCLEPSWANKSAGCRGIRFMANLPGLGLRWTMERIVELVRTLLHVLKDMPYDLPSEVKEVSDTMELVLRVGYHELTTAENVDPTFSRNAMAGLTGVFFAELSGQSAIVRKAAHQCIERLTQLTGIPTSELLMPHRERMLTAIYTKPLRALPFPAQVGIVEGIRYCLSLDPPLPELSDELLRLLHEALALADAEDVQLISRSNQRHNSMEIVKLRVACIKLLTASMPLTDFFAKQNNTRQR